MTSDSVPQCTGIDFDPVHPSLVTVGDSDVVFRYWDAKRGSKFAPVWRQEFWLEELPLKVVPNLSVVDVIDGGKNYRYRFWGSANVSRKGYDMTGKLLTETPTERSIPTGYLHFGWILENRAPLATHFNPHFLLHGYPNLVTYRFPLSSDGETVDKIVTYQPLNIERTIWEDAFKELRKQNTINR